MTATVSRRAVLAAGCMLSLAVQSQSQAQTQTQPGPTIVGWIEPVTLAGGQLSLEAKLDTGADVSSLDARDMRMFERDGRSWVSFAVPDRKGKRLRLARPVERMMEIKKASGGAQDRPVVLLEVCLGGVERLTTVNLVDRKQLSTPMLLGRSYLEGHFAVDSARTRTTAPDCSNVKR
jgi:hypothetical protein